MVAIWCGEQIGCSEDLEDGTRRLAIELLLVMCEQKAQVMRKSPDVVKKLIPLFMNVRFDSDLCINSCGY